MELPPKIIYLQQSEDPYEVGLEDGEDTTWCEDPIDAYDVKYRIDEDFYKLEQQNKALRELVGDFERILAITIQSLDKYPNMREISGAIKTEISKKDILNKLEEIGGE